ncbi:unnamed protein product [Closterium sp. Yama58-4]|nr:unnamed protein product [Closterium sp. Yama58-4]
MFLGPAGLEFQPYDCHHAVHPRPPSGPHLNLVVQLHPSGSSHFSLSTAPSLLPRLLHRCRCSLNVPPPYKKDHSTHYFQYQVVLKPVALQTGTHSPDPLQPRFLLAVPLLVLSLAMVIAGEPWPTPSPAAAASAVSGRSLPVAASETAALKPPLPPALKAASSAPVAAAQRPAPPAPVAAPAGQDPAAAPAPPAPAAVPAPPALVAAPVPPAPDAAVLVPPVDLGAPPVAAAPVAPAAAVGSAAPVVSQPAVSATTAGQSLVVGPVEAPAPPAAAISVPLPNVQAVPDPAPLAAVPPAQRQLSPGRRQPRDEREMTRRRRDSPRCRGSQANWAASRGGRGGWWGGRGRGGDWGYDRTVSMADLQRAVSAAVREERNGQASQSNSPRVAPAHASPPPAAPYAPAPPLPQSVVPPPHVHSASAAAHVNRMRLPWVPPVAGGPATGQYPSLLPVDPAPPAAPLPQLSLVGPSPSAVVPEASLGGHRDECLDAADRLGELLAPVLAAPARGGVAGVGQLGTAVRGLRRFLREGTAVDLIGATTVVVRKLHRSLMGLLAVLDADQM